VSELARRMLELVSAKGGKGVWSERGRAKKRLGDAFGSLGFLAVHAELAVAGEERGVVVVSIAAVGSFVVFLEELLDRRVGDGSWESGKLETHVGRFDV